MRADSKVLDRLAAGEAGAYGPLLGRDRFLLGKDAQRSQAESAVPSMGAALWSFKEVETRLTRQETALAAFANLMPEPEALLAWVATSLTRSPEKVLGFDRPETERRDLATTRAAVQQVASRIYFNPQEATRALLADPKGARPTRQGRGRRLW
jgi:hypothetical protein